MDAELKKLKVEAHNKAYIESKKPKTRRKRSRAEERKAKQVIAMMLSLSGRSLSGGV